MIKDLPILKFNNIDYRFSIKVKNNVKEKTLATGGWTNLVIIDDFFTPFLRGQITVINDFESFERTPIEVRDVLLPNNSDYKFRGDGRDEIEIIIFPENPTGLDNDDPSLTAYKEYFEDEELWGIKIEGFIYDYQDDEVDGRENKRKTLFFREKGQTYFMEKNVEFSSHQVLEKEGKSRSDIINMNNDERAVSTSKILKELLTTQPEFELNMQYADDPEYWDVGHDDSKMMFVSPTNSNLDGDVDYLLANHRAIIKDAENSDGSEILEYCLLKLDRAKKLINLSNDPKNPEVFKQFTLKPLYSYFKKNIVNSKAGDYYTETFLIKTTDEPNDIHLFKTPSSRNDKKPIFCAETMSEIRDFEFQDMVPDDYIDRMVEKNIIFYNYAEKSFHLTKNKPQKSVDHLNENYVKKNLVMTGKKGQTAFIESDYLKDHYKVLTNYSSNKLGVNRSAEYHNDLLFLNNSISMSVMGATIRNTGKFFGVQKLTENNTDYDHKVEGQYFTTMVAHVFDTKEGIYYNNIVGSKFYNYDTITDLGESGLTEGVDFNSANQPNIA
jgi:hypothetical protein